MVRPVSIYDYNGKAVYMGDTVKRGRYTGTVKYDEFEGFYIVTDSGYSYRLDNGRFTILKGGKRK